ncbi:hypothetical protein Fmac_032782 [Flemingia macrophylla]|uniref:Uncharacterized protein n=1 Tax=Flemingia macrophylla TaxID=520843 RepID=A0ABD1L5W3_9FABA
MQPPIVQPIPPPIVEHTPSQPIPSQTIPSSMASQCLGVRRTSLSSPSQHNVSPMSIPSRLNENQFQEEQEMPTDAGGASTNIDDDPPIGAVLQIIEPCNDGNPKGRVYGVGKLTEDYMRGDRLTQQTSSSIAADSQKIIQLEEEVRQSREEVRQSREENQRLQRKL